LFGANTLSDVTVESVGIDETKQNKRRRGVKKVTRDTYLSSFRTRGLHEQVFVNSSWSWAGGPVNRGGTCANSEGQKKDQGEKPNRDYAKVEQRARPEKGKQIFGLERVK